MPVEKEEWVLDAITGTIMGVCNWIMLRSFFSRKQKQTVLKVIKNKNEKVEGK